MREPGVNLLGPKISKTHTPNILNTRTAKTLFFLAAGLTILNCAPATASQPAQVPKTPKPMTETINDLSAAPRFASHEAHLHELTSTSHLVKLDKVSVIKNSSDIIAAYGKGASIQLISVRNISGEDMTAKSLVIGGRVIDGRVTGGRKFSPFPLQGQRLEDGNIVLSKGESGLFGTICLPGDSGVSISDSLSDNKAVLIRILDDGKENNIKLHFQKAWQPVDDQNGVPRPAGIEREASTPSNKYFMVRTVRFNVHGKRCELPISFIGKNGPIHITKIIAGNGIDARIGSIIPGNPLTSDTLQISEKTTILLGPGIDLHGLPTSIKIIGTEGPDNTPFVIELPLSYGYAHYHFREK